MTTVDFLDITEEEVLNKYDIIKNNIKKYIGKQKLIQVLTDLVDESKTFEFRNLRVKKTINLDNPMLILKFKPEYMEDVDKYKIVSNLLHEEIISKYSDFITKEITDNELILSNFSTAEREILLNSNALRTITFLSSTIFRIVFSKDENIVCLQYVL